MRIKLICTDDSFKVFSDAFLEPIECDDAAEIYARAAIIL